MCDCSVRCIAYYSGTSPYGHLTSKKTSQLQSPWLSPKLYSTVQITPCNKVTSQLRSLLPSPEGDLNNEVPLYCKSNQRCAFRTSLIHFVRMYVMFIIAVLSCNLISETVIIVGRYTIILFKFIGNSSNRQFILTNETVLMLLLNDHVCRKYAYQFVCFNYSAYTDSGKGMGVIMYTSA